MAGAPQTAYQNRTDLNPSTPGSVPVAAATGQPYGEAGAQLAAQRQVPIGTPPGPPAGGAAPVAPPPAQAPIPGQVANLLGPDDHPERPITHGVPIGPGPGPSGPFASSSHTLGTFLSQLAAAPNATPEVKGLLDFVQSGRL